MGFFHKSRVTFDLPSLLFKSSLACKAQSDIAAAGVTVISLVWPETIGETYILSFS